MVVDKSSAKVICTDFSAGKKHDFRLFKESKVRIKQEAQFKVDSGYLGIKRYHANSQLPQKGSKKKKLSKEQKMENRELSAQRVLNENVIGSLKRFRILAERYRNRRKRFALRFNLIAGIYNYELQF